MNKRWLKIVFYLYKWFNGSTSSLLLIKNIEVVRETNTHMTKEQNDMVATSKAFKSSFYSNILKRRNFELILVSTDIFKWQKGKDEEVRNYKLK